MSGEYESASYGGAAAAAGGGGLLLLPLLPLLLRRRRRRTCLLLLLLLPLSRAPLMLVRSASALVCSARESLLSGAADASRSLVRSLSRSSSALSRDS
jgi:hypothetical protein